MVPRIQAHRLDPFPPEAAPAVARATAERKRPLQVLEGAFPGTRPSSRKESHEPKAGPVLPSPPLAAGGRGPSDRQPRRRGDAEAHHPHRRRKRQTAVPGQLAVKHDLQKRRTQLVRRKTCGPALY